MHADVPAVSDMLMLLASLELVRGNAECAVKCATIVSAAREARFGRGSLSDDV